MVCKQDKKSCVRAATDLFKATKLACTGDASERKTCKREAKEVFKSAKRECKRFHEEECAPCCRAGGTDCERRCTPSEEVCDGADNDCDSEIDESDPNLGARCGTSDVGACELGTFACLSGLLECVGNVEPTAETCGDGVDQDCDGGDPSCVVTITAPASLDVFGSSPITVEGTVAGGDAAVTCNGSPAEVTGGTFTASVALEEGNNTITCVAGGPAAQATASVTVTLDTTPPIVTIRSPEGSSMVSADAVTVTGSVNDVVVGTVNAEQATVVCNGVDAAVANRAFLAAGVALALGGNSVTCTATDRAGNMGSDTVDVERGAVAVAGVRIVSGDRQTGGIGTTLTEPLVVEVVDESGAPVPGATVIFRVKENNGALAGIGIGGGRGLAVTTDGAGRAQATWTLGTRAGAGNNVVEAAVVGLPGSARFAATATAGAPARVLADGGAMQTGVPGQPLPHPFVVAVMDAGDNRLAGVPVRFVVDRGGGSFAGASEAVVMSDGDGRAAAVLTLGPDEGIENNGVAVNFESATGRTLTFTASAMVPGDPAATRVSGVVLDNSDLPVPGVTIRIPGTALGTQSNAEGQFNLTGVPVGRIDLVVDGSTASRPGVWPAIPFEMVTVAGRDNTLGRAIYLLPIDVPNGLFVSETEGGRLEAPAAPGFSLTVAPGSATFPDSSKRGVVSVTVVNTEKVPMVPNLGVQPRFIVTIQPAGVRFDPPAAVTFPNVDALAPGTVTELQSFDHDLGQFLSIGTGTVSEDGSVVASDPGVGILKGGWHNCGCNPRNVGDCSTCLPCENLVKPLFFGSPYCEPDSGRDGARCSDFDVLHGRNADIGIVEAHGVKVSIERNCTLGMCQDGKCEPLHPQWGLDNIKPAAVDALGKIFDDTTPCMGDALRMKMQNNLKTKGFSIVCASLPPGANNACGTAEVGGNKMTLGGKPCLLPRTIRHEMHHATGEQNHFRTCLDGESASDCSMDAVYGCDVKCYGSSNRSTATAASCP
jgi:hypothetical protein